MTGRCLELCSGYLPTLGFEHLDLNPNAPLVDYHCDVAGPLPFADGTFERIKAHDCLEHCAWSDTERILTEWARVLMRGGVLDLMVPDAEAIFRRHVTYSVAGEAGRAMAERDGWIPPHLADMPLMQSAVWRLFGGLMDGVAVHDGDDPRLNLHMAAFSRESLAWYLDRAGPGFDVERMETNPHPNILCIARKR